MQYYKRTKYEVIYKNEKDKEIKESLIKIKSKIDAFI
jgi:hypothetical protein